MNAVSITIIVISSIFLIIIIALAIFFYMKYRYNKSVLYYALINPLYCGKDACPTPIKDLNIPQNIDNSYNKAVARFCADLIARVEHGVKNDIPMPKNLTKIGVLYNYKEDPIFGVVWANADITWVIFRGTSDPVEWAQDFNAKQAILPQKQAILPQKHVAPQKQLHLRNTTVTPAVHAGFLEVYNNFRDEMYKLLESIKPKKVIVSGHSLGGGVATICGLDLKISGYDVFTYTFAGPKAGDEVFCQLVTSSKLPLYRIVNGMDIVPTLPTSVVPNYDNKEDLFFYQHCGAVLEFNSNGKSIACNHLMPIYINALDKNLFQSIRSKR